MKAFPTIIPTETYFAMVRQSLEDTGSAFVRVTGASMLPLLRHHRDGVVVVPPGEIRAGDIVLFDRRNGRWALHRVIRTGPNGFTMAGDNQRHLEKNLPYDRVVGVAAVIERKGKRIPCSRLSLRAYARAAILRVYSRVLLRRLWGRLRRGNSLKGAR